MRKPGEWMQLPTDERILEVLDRDIVLSPAIVAYNIDRTREQVTRRLAVLTKFGLVDKIEKGRYQITDLGREYLDGEFDASTLDE